ncbi:MAG: PAS domain S-box protein [Candidatus Omnitrophica bacterium]|nr:PAS domain S-box protein [Candidatus Omnitrophota bacterium]
MKFSGIRLKILFSLLLTAGVSFFFCRRGVPGLFFSLGFALILGGILANGIVIPIRRITHIARLFAGGVFNRRILSPADDETGELAGTLNEMAHNIERRVNAGETGSRKLSAVLSSMVEGVLVLGHNADIVSLNPTAEQLFGISRKDAEGKIFLEAIRNNDIAEVINDVYKGAGLVSREISFMYPRRGTFEVNASPIYDNEIVSGCLVVVHDITEIRRLETVRSDFVANVSHELKTPLTSIRGFVETLLEGAIDDKKNNREFLRIIQAHAERLTVLVEDLLSLSHLESKGIELDKQPLALKPLIDGIITGFSAQSKKRNIDVRNGLSGDVVIHADRNKIEHVFTNVIDNAIKFNREKGSVLISSRENDTMIEISVEDFGIGIPEKDKPRIFERFYRVDKARSRAEGGTGLGLSIVKHIVELHGGTVALESAEGVGSRFTIKLPI